MRQIEAIEAFEHCGRERRVVTEHGRAGVHNSLMLRGARKLRHERHDLASDVKRAELLHLEQSVNNTIGVFENFHPTKLAKNRVR